jgi:hypothetical protein
MIYFLALILATTPATTTPPDSWVALHFTSFQAAVTDTVMTRPSAFPYPTGDDDYPWVVIYKYNWQNPDARKTIYGMFKFPQGAVCAVAAVPGARIVTTPNGSFFLLTREEVGAQGRLGQ